LGDSVNFVISFFGLVWLVWLIDFFKYQWLFEIGLKDLDKLKGKPNKPANEMNQINAISPH